MVVALSCPICIDPYSSCTAPWYLPSWPRSPSLQPQPPAPTGVLAGLGIVVVLALVTGFLWEGRAIQLSRMSSEPETDIASLGPSFGPSTAVGPGGKTGFLDGRLAGIDVDALEWVKLTSSEWSFLHDPTRALAQLHTIHDIDY